MNDTPRHAAHVSPVEIAREYGPFDTSEGVAGVTVDALAVKHLGESGGLRQSVGEADGEAVRVGLNVARQ